MNTKTLKRLLPLLLVPLVATACDEGGTTGPADGSARVSLLLTDAPGDVEAAVVTITDVYLQGAEGQAESNGRVYLRQNDPVTTDLLTLSNDVIALAEDYDIPAGTYSQLRFVISGAYLEVENASGGTTVYATTPDYEGLPAGVEAEGELHCPSCGQSGLKVVLGPVNGDWEVDYEDEVDEPVVFDGEQTILVDFDVSKSFGKQAGQSGRWVMRPALKATRLVSAAELRVTLGLDDPALELPLIGDAPLDLGSFEVTVTPASGGDPKVAELVDEDGDGIYEVSFGYLFPGEYHVGLVGVPGLSFATDAALPLAVDLEQGAEATVDLKLLELTVDQETDVEA